MGFLRQSGTLASKNLRIILGRKAFTTVFMALIVPIGLTIFFAFARNLFIPPSVFGIGKPHPVMTLPQAIAASVGTGRDRLVFVNNGHEGGDIDRVIDAIVPTLTQTGKSIHRIASETELNTICRSSLRGVTLCFGAVVFRSSPNEGPGGLWNYTIRTDGALGTKIDVDKTDNDAQIYLLPMQRTVDAAIAGLNASSDRAPFPATTQEYPFTDLTQEERAVRIRVTYQGIIQNWLGVSFITTILWITYHLTGFIATEREIGMIQLIDSMMPVRRRWHAQAARLVSYWASFSLVYLPGWVIGSLILRGGVFARTNVGIVLLYHILAGLAMASMSIMVASLFKKAQLSGNTAILATLLLGILAQSITWPRTATVAVLSLLFTPCNYVYFISFMARYEAQDTGTNLLQAAPQSPWNLPGIVLWVFLIIQIFGYVAIAAVVETSLHSTSAKGRSIITDPASQSPDEAAVKLDGFTKIYRPSAVRRMFSFIAKPREPVVAVNGLSLEAGRGQILALLGANGSGKSTTLDCIAGMNKLTSGSISIDGTGGLGIAPQKNVLWDDLTVEEHIKYFNRLKSTGQSATKQECRDLIRAIDLEPKRKALSKTLSGGQKRKLQLGMMLTGGSSVCCVDEVSSGLDPLSRRKIWDILLAERGRRTLILTTHFLDEADLLADQIVILSKGTLRARGSSVELKEKLGGGYRIHVNNTHELKNTPDIASVEKKTLFDVVTYVASTSGLAAQVIRELEALGITDYSFSGPTIEDVFLQLAEEVKEEEAAARSASAESIPQTPQPDEKKGPSSEVVVADEEPSRPGLKLLDGRRIGYFQQAGVLFRKRFTIFKSSWMPYVTALLLPVAAAGLVTLFIRGQQPVGCSPAEQGTTELAEDAFGVRNLTFHLVAGPRDRFSQANLINLFLPVLGALNSSGGSGGLGSGLGRINPASLLQNVTLVDSYDAFNTLIVEQRKNITPSGWWLGDASSQPTVAYLGNRFFLNGLFGQNFLDIMLTNTSIATSWAPFDIPWAPNTGNSLQLLVYSGIALAAYPGFFALYPSIERRRNVRGLEYSNGVRPLPLWMAYLAFDFSIVLVSSALITIIWAAASQIWYHIGFIFVVLMFYGLASILLAYVVSLFCKTQLSTYAWVAAGQGVMFLVYLIAYLCTITYAPITRVDHYLLVVHFTVSAFAPIGSVVRAMFLALNLFSTTCDGDRISGNPGGILGYGGPILYLIIQSLLLFGILLWADSGAVGNAFRRLWQSRIKEGDDPNASDEEVANELARVTSNHDGNTDGLRVMHVTKSFGKNTAVDNVTFGIQRGEVFALLGPNGAGKSTTISLIRGDIQPSRNGGDIFVEDKSVIHQLAAARAHLGVCPQFDAMDLMTVREHLEFYARIRGISDINHNVNAVLRAVGLEAFSERMAQALSGGNKRKLSLGIALMGNPTVVLLDEPSSGLDAAAKRVMWKTLAATVPGRSILLTTHSMEEADALASRAGILARRMLAMGTTDQLRRRFGDALHIHLVSKTAPRTTAAEMEGVRQWVERTLPGAVLEEKTYHGQMRFAVPVSSVAAAAGNSGGHPQQQGDEILRDSEDVSGSAIGQLVVLLEEAKDKLGIEFYSVSPTTLDQVFLAIVGRHNVQEENYGEKQEQSWWRWRK